MPDDPYLLLGISRNATSAEITEAYRALVQIYHPDRYAEAPPRVQAEANTRMQALNAAYEQVKKGTRSGPPTPPPPTPPPPPRRPPPPGWEEPVRPTRTSFVHYVDGARGFHNGAVAPLGFAVGGGEARPARDAIQCTKLNGELLAWFELQRRNADLAAKQMYASWTPDEQAMYAAKLGCTQVARDKARSLAIPCGECGA